MLKRLLFSGPTMLVAHCSGALAFQPLPTSLIDSSHTLRRHSPVGPLNVISDREADYVEMVLGGERYEMVPLPDRMIDTTIYVGNICEFVHDEDLSTLFQSVSKLQSVPACVVRRANMASLQYGFVSFPTVEEKEVSLLCRYLLG